ncbi:MAG: zinc-binding dehydrogenase family oxidoreductase [Phenylobacterium sp.]|nr:zinc-binding dehydrogenase family oxidoreductase [Phenylobacterium sp.]
MGRPQAAVLIRQAPKETDLLAAVLRAPGPPSVFSFEEAPTPAITEDEVLVRVRACGVSYRDVLERNGTYKRDVVFPLIPGLEISGEVEAVGAAVRDLAAGDRVCTKAFASCGDCRYCRTGRETTCRRRRPVRGGYSQYAAIPQDAVVRTPPDMAFEISCVLGPGAGVALNAVRDTARVALGETVLVTGATGGVGLPAVSLSRLAGARVICMTRSEAKRGLLIEAGAHEVLVAPEGVDFSAAVLALTEGEGADVVIDTVGNRVFEAAFKALAPHGRYAMVGQLFREEIAINPARIFFKRAQILGVGSVSRAQLDDVIALTARGQLKPRIGKILPLTELAEAHRLVEAAEVQGRVVVTP